MKPNTPGRMAVVCGMDGREDALKRPLDVTDFEHIASLAAGTLLIFGGWRRGGPIGALMKLGGAACLFRGQQGYKRLYQAVGLELPARATGVGDYNVRVDSSVEIAQTPRELYRVWRNFENLPVFMEYLESVREIDETRSEWTVKTAIGAPLKWEARIINDIPDELIAWESLEGSGVDNAGSVRFEDRGNGRTRLKVVLRYDPPADQLGQAIAKLFGKDAQAQVDDSLTRFKRYMELNKETA